MVKIPQEELIFTFARSSGAGGQNVNKVNSKAVLRWNARESRVLVGSLRERFMARYGSKLTVNGELVLASDRHRDQVRNVADCIEKLRELLASVATPPKRRVKTKPTYGSKQRRLNDKKAHGEKKRGRTRADEG